MNLTLLVGPVGSGKSTFAETRARDGALIVCDDAIVLAVHGGVYGAHDRTHKPLYVACETAIITHAAALGRDVVVDRGCRTTAVRTRFTELGRSLGFAVDAVLFEWHSPVVHATRRWKHDPRGMTYLQWLTVCRKHAAEFEPLTAAEGIPWTAAPPI